MCFLETIRVYILKSVRGVRFFREKHCIPATFCSKAIHDTRMFGNMAMDCFHDHYETLQIELPSHVCTPIQRCMQLARMSSDSLLEGFNKVKSKLEETQSEEALRKLNEAWEVLGDKSKRNEYNLVVLNQAMKDWFCFNVEAFLVWAWLKI